MTPAQVLRDAIDAGLGALDAVLLGHIQKVPNVDWDAVEKSCERLREAKRNHLPAVLARLEALERVAEAARDTHPGEQCLCDDEMTPCAAHMVLYSRIKALDALDAGAGKGGGE